MIRIEKLFFSKEMCERNSDEIFVFGDNLIGKGKAGQACIRDCDNAIGIPTKRLPSMKEGSFFSDRADEFEAVDAAIELVERKLEEGNTVVLPVSGFGTGLAKMESKSPRLFSHLTKRIMEILKKRVVVHTTNGKGFMYSSNHVNDWIRREW